MGITSTVIAVYSCHKVECYFEYIDVMMSIIMYIYVIYLGFGIAVWAENVKISWIIISNFSFV